MNADERFWERVERGADDECWPWDGKRGTRQYGAFYYRGGMVGAHRLAWRLTFGEIPDGLQVCHACDNPPCCNPSHLFVGTAADNIRDAARKGRLRNSPAAPSVYQRRTCSAEGCRARTWRADGLCRHHSPPRPFDHGTRNAYSRGCRCPDCTAANRAYHQAYMVKRREG